jgi:hypothetical protein
MDEDMPTSQIHGDGPDPTGTPVLFTSGNMTAARTRADDPLGSKAPYYWGMNSTTSVPYMGLNGRFVCTMYYHATVGATDASDFDIKDVEDGGTMTTAWLKVDDNAGNSVYWNKAYPDSYEPIVDEYGFDKSATMFYWQNRLTHVFLALADYNKLTTNDGDATVQGKLKMYPDYDMDFVTLPAEPTEEQLLAYANKLSDNRYANKYDLTRGETYDSQGNLTGYTINSITEQPDPILALTIMKPAGATQEANRVHLYFRHQFSQIQVNVKGANDNSANITTEQIEKVELLGISTEGYVCNRLNADGTVGPAKGKDVRLDEFSDAILDNNKWGTSFEMFDMAGSGAKIDEDGNGIDDRYALGFLKSFNAIAFGQLSAIRITWHEGTTAEPGIKHVATFEVPATNETGLANNSPGGSSAADDSTNKKPVVQLRQLQSGMKYIYDLELRRGTLAIIRTQILDWMQKEPLVYATDGTIIN